MVYIRYLQRAEITVLKTSEEENSMAQRGNSVLYMQTRIYFKTLLLNPLSYS